MDPRRPLRTLPQDEAPQGLHHHFAESAAYYVRAYVGGREFRRSTRTGDPAVARREAARIVAELHAAGASAPRAGRLRMSQLRQWDEDEAVRLGRSPGRIRELAYLWDRVTERLADVDLLRWSYSAALGYVEARQGDGAGGQTIRKEMGCIKRGLRLARIHGYSVPVRVEWPKVASTPKTAQAGMAHPLPVLRAWLAELRAGLAANNRSTMQGAIQAEFILLTGLRVEEARRVTLAWVARAPEGDPVPAYLEVPSQAAKTRTPKRVGLCERALDLLLEADAIVGIDGAPLVPGDDKTGWRAAAQRIGYPHPIRPRDLRHC